jgi:phage-related minor tail protein
MALVVGEIMAKIGADRSEQIREFKAAEADHKKLVKDIEGRPAKVDADTSQVDTKLGKTADAAKATGQQINTAFSSAWKSVVADLDRVEKQAWQAGQGMDDAFTTSLSGLREQLDRLRADAASTGAGLESELGQALLSVRGDAERMRADVTGALDSVGDAAEDAGDSIASGLGSKLEDGLMDLGKSTVALASGAALGQAIMTGLEQEWEEGRVGGLIEAQTGAAAGSAGRLGEVAGGMFRDHFGQSIEDVGRAMTAVFQNDLIDEGAAVADLEKVTGKVITASDVMEEEFNNVARSAQQAVRTGLADNVGEALDMITHATQEGLNVAGDLLDTVTEYGTSFREVGLQGAEAFGLLRQAQLGGARDIDYAADAIKEFGILAQDTASTASRGFTQLGLDGEKMGRMIAAGGKPAREALLQTLNALREMPPGIERNSIAVDLFGTKAEDLGDSLFRMDLDTAAAQFGDFGGSVDEAGRALADAVPPLERFHQGFMRMLDDAAGGIAKLNDVSEGLPEGLQGFEGLDIFSPDDAEEVNEGAEAMDKAAHAADNAADSTINYAGTIDDLINKQREMADGVISLSEAQIRNQQATADAHGAMEEFAGEGVNKTKTAFDLTTVAGQEMQGALNDVASSTQDTIAAMREQGATSQQVAGFMKDQRRTFVELATGMGLSEGAANALADALIGIPDRVTPRIGIQDTASPILATIKRRLDAMPKNVRTDYYLYTHYRQSGSASARNLNPNYGGYGGLAEGAVMEYYADGGMRPMSASYADIVQPHTRTGFMRVIADNPVADEAFIPIEPSNPRSQAILDETLKRMRPDLASLAGALGMASGGILGGAYGTGAVVGMPAAGGRAGHTFNLYGPDPRAAAREVLDLIRAEEALRG